MVCRELVAEGGAEYLLGGLLLVGGFSTKEVSVVRKVASVSGGALRSRYGDSCECDGTSLWRANDCGIGAFTYRLAVG